MNVIFYAKNNIYWIKKYVIPGLIRVLKFRGQEILRFQNSLIENLSLNKVRIRAFEVDIFSNLKKNADISH